jgi:hypothetical protein
MDWAELATILLGASILGNMFQGARISYWVSRLHHSDEQYTLVRSDALYWEKYAEWLERAHWQQGRVHTQVARLDEHRGELRDVFQERWEEARNEASVGE